MAAYLTGKKLGTRQWYDSRRDPLTGCTVLHDAENAMDVLGPDAGAENVAEFIRTRGTAGSYHDLVDSDTGVQLVEYHHGAFHDGTGSNNWALSLSFACRTVDWARMSPERRRGFLWQGALRFVAQQKWRKANRAPLTRLRYITKAQSDRGESGFCCHGWRDPNRRTDPGTKAPHLFPFDEWLAVCAETLGQFMPDHPDAATAAPAPAQQEESDLMFISLGPDESLTFPRPNGGQVTVKLALDNNGDSTEIDVADQRVRVGVHAVGRGWRAVFAPGEKADPMIVWLPTQETRQFTLNLNDDIAVIRNLHPRWNLGVTITHEA